MSWEFGEGRSVKYLGEFSTAVCWFMLFNNNNNNNNNNNSNNMMIMIIIPWHNNPFKARTSQTNDNSANLRVMISRMLSPQPLLTFETELYVIWSFKIYFLCFAVFIHFKMF